MSDTVLVLRKCKANGESSSGFVYPMTGHIEAPDWDGKPECGHGLHGLLWGHGDFDIDSYGNRFVVIAVNPADLVEFDGKCKFKGGEVLLNTESQLDAITLIKNHPNYPKDNILNYDISDKTNYVAGYRCILKGGDGATLTGGDRATLTGGDGATLKAGINSVIICRWYDNGEHVKSRIITKETANKTYTVKDDKWIEVK